VSTAAIKFHAYHAPDVYEVVVNGARIGSVQRYGRREFVAQVPPVLPHDHPVHVHGWVRRFEFRTRREAGEYVRDYWNAAHA
jgi:hypothetical protein